MKPARMTRNLASTSGGLQAKNNASPSNTEDPCQGETLLQPDKAMQPMHGREVFHYHQTGIDNVKQTERFVFELVRALARL